jgi:hypothetical protein
MVDEEAPADAGPGVDLDAGEGPIQVGKPPGQELQLSNPQPVSQPVAPDSVKARVREEEFQLISGRRITLEGCPDVLSDGADHGDLFSVSPS